MAESSLESLLNYSRRDIILEEIIKVVKSISCNGNVLRVLKTEKKKKRKGLIDTIVN